MAAGVMYREKIRNFRLIALINSDCKIFMKIIANRLNSLILPKLIKKHQNGFCSGRIISDTMLGIQLVLEQGGQTNLFLLDAFLRLTKSL